jgi:hypothetical protein
MKAIKWLQLLLVFAAAMALCWPVFAQQSAPGFHSDANSLQGQALEGC